MKRLARLRGTFVFEWGSPSECWRMLLTPKHVIKHEARGGPRIDERVRCTRCIVAGVVAISLEGAQRTSIASPWVCVRDVFLTKTSCGSCRRSHGQSCCTMLFVARPSCIHGCDNFEMRCSVDCLHSMACLWRSCKQGAEWGYCCASGCRTHV